MKASLFLGILVLLVACSEDNSSNDSKVEQVSIEEKKVANTDQKAEIPPRSKTVQLHDFKSKYNFAAFRTQEFKGGVADPDFSTSEFSDDPEYVKFIIEGCKKNGINFAGHYTIIQRGCGAMCLHLFIVDRITGRIFTDTKLNEGKWGYLFKADSRLLIANAEAFTDSTLTKYTVINGIPELYKWNGNIFQVLE